MNYIRYILILALFILPGVSNAAPVEQKNPIFPYRELESRFASTANENTGVFGITFTLNATGEDVYLRTGTERVGDLLDIMGKGIEYGIYNGDNVRVGNGTALGMITSALTPTNGYYVIKANTSSTFTLLVAYVAPKSTRMTDEGYHLKLEGFRYSLRSPGNQSILESAGLKAWKTKELTLKTE